MKAKDSINRTGELLLAATFGGLFSFFISKFFDTWHYLWIFSVIFLIIIVSITMFIVYRYIWDLG